MPDQQRRLTLATASWRDLGRVLRLGFLPAQISHTSPRGLRVAIGHVDAAKPPMWIVFSDAGRALPDADRRRVYVEHLDAHRDDVLAQIAHVGARNPRLALLCWCDVGRVPCHRRWLAEWWTAGTGHPMPEVGEAHPLPPPPEALF